MGAALPAVRVELNPTALFKYGIGLEDVRASLASANANSPKGSIESDTLHYQLYTNDQATHAADYRPLVIAYRNGGAVRLSDVADVQDSVENLRNAGLSQASRPCWSCCSAKPGANIIDTVNSVKGAIPQLMAALPRDMDLLIANDRSTTIQSSLRDTELTLLISVGLVTLVVFLFLRSARATLIPAIAVPVSIVGTFGTMYLLNYTLDALSLMALTVATGFVVDDAIVVLENISRHIEDGMPRVQAALRGAREVSFTVISISLSLIAVFLPILLMGGIVGRLFREFAMTLSLAIMVSLAISLTTTPMMCALMLKPADLKQPRKRTLFDRVQAPVRADVGLVAAAFVAGGPGTADHHRHERLAVCDRAKRLLSRTRQRPVDRRPASGSKHLFPVDAAKAAASVRHRAARPGGPNHGRVYRRRWRTRFRFDQHGFSLRRAEGAGTARRYRCGHEPAAPAVEQCGRGKAVPVPRFRIFAPAAGPATRPINTRCRPTASRSCMNGDQNWLRH